MCLPRYLCICMSLHPAICLYICRRKGVPLYHVCASLQSCLQVGHSPSTAYCCGDGIAKDLCSLLLRLLAVSRLALADDD